MITLGFSDHIFMPGIHDSYSRGDYEMLGEYVSSLRSLKAKYARAIQIHIGFESEYFPSFDHYYRRLLDDGIVEYLILGHHFMYANGKLEFYYGVCKTPERIHEYADGVVRGMATGLFKYVAHPDLFMAGYRGDNDEHIQAVTRQICEASKRLDVPLELNLGAMRFRGLFHDGYGMRYLYPYEPFWKVVGEMGCKVIIGVDAHHPNELLGQEYKYAEDLIEKYHLNYIKHLDI
jgi:histidinol-phosphatase (PHP family)